MTKDNKRFIPIDETKNPKQRFIPTNNEDNTKKRFAPINDEDNTKKRFTPVNEKDNIKQRFAPINKEKSVKERFAPINDADNTKKRFTPVNEKDNIKQRFAPTNNEKNVKERFIPTNKKTNTNNNANRREKIINANNKDKPIKEIIITENTNTNTKPINKSNSTKKKNIIWKIVFLLIVAFLAFEMFDNKNSKANNESVSLKDNINNSQNEIDTNEKENKDEDKYIKDELIEVLPNDDMINEEIENYNDIYLEQEYEQIEQVELENLDTVTEQERIDISNLMHNSIFAFTQAVNQRDVSIVLPYYTYEGPLYKEQSRVVNHFHDRGIREEMKYSTVTNITKINENEYTVNTKSVINIYKDYEWRLRGFDAKYYVFYINGEYLIDSIIYENEIPEEDVVR